MLKIVDLVDLIPLTPILKSERQRVNPGSPIASNTTEANRHRRTPKFP